MKVAIILLSILSMAATWWAHSARDRRVAKPSVSQKIRLAAKSVAVGAAVYFGLMLLALGYLALTRG